MTNDAYRELFAEHEVVEEAIRLLVEPALEMLAQFDEIVRRAGADHRDTVRARQLLDAWVERDFARARDLVERREQEPT